MEFVYEAKQLKQIFKTDSSFFAISLPSLSFTPAQVKPLTSSLGCIRCVYHEGGGGGGGGIGQRILRGNLKILFKEKGGSVKNFRRQEVGMQNLFSFFFF